MLSVKACYTVWVSKSNRNLKFLKSISFGLLWIVVSVSLEIIPDQINSYRDIINQNYFYLITKSIIGRCTQNTLFSDNNLNLKRKHTIMTYNGLIL